MGLVSCVCPTMESRREWLPKAIECFLAQDWEEKELVIVADYSKDIAIPDSVRWISMFPISGAMSSIGFKRNLGTEQSTGEFICHADDDDTSYPGRITDQVNRLIETGKSVTGYHSIQFVNESGKRWQYQGGPSWAFDTSLCYRKSFWEKNPFNHVNDGLEAGFRATAIREGVFISVPGTDMMHASIHDGNTGPRDMTPGNSSWLEL